MATSTGAVAGPSPATVSIGHQAPASRKSAPTKSDVDEAIVKIVVVASVVYLWHLTRNLDPDLKHAARDDDVYVLTDDEAAALGPSVRRLLALVPGGKGSEAAVNLGEHLSVVFVLMAYAERTAPLRVEARNAGPARRMLPARAPRRVPSPTSNAGKQAPPNVQSVQPDAHGPGTQESGTSGPAIAPGVIGSQYL